MVRYCESCGTELTDVTAGFCRSCGSPAGTPTGGVKKRPPRLLFGVLAAAVVALGIGVVLLLSGEDPKGSSAHISPLSPQEVPPDVALVTHVPSSEGHVTRRELDRAIEQEAALEGSGAVPPVGEKRYDKLKEAALRTIFDSIWIEGQAIEMGISVTPAQIDTELAQIKRQNFKTEAAYRKFLETSHFTERDTRERVKLQLLSTEVQARVTSQVRSRSSTQLTQQEQEAAFEKFVSGYQSRWKSRTVCAPDFAVEECANG
jgi:parvulin-like peptidyl-prolyl isomerase